MSSMVILMGLPGSGKSTLANQFKDFKIINQDKIGNRYDCLFAAEKHLSEGQSVVIDRTNINKKQRKYFIEIANKLDVNVYCVYLDIPKESCIKNILHRPNHETLPSGAGRDKINKVVSKFEKDMQFPELEEGFEEVILLNSVTVSISHILLSTIPGNAPKKKTS